MTFRLTEFESVSFTQIVDVRTPGNRYNRSRVEGNKKSYWMIDLVTASMKYDQAMATAAYLDSLKGSLEIIQFPSPLPELATRSGLTNYSSDLVNSNLASIGGFSPNQSLAVRAGDFFKYSNHPKVYRFRDDANANSSGQASIVSTPERFINTTQGESMQYGNDVFFQCCLDDYVSMDVSAQNSKFVKFNITLVEQG